MSMKDIFLIVVTAAMSSLLTYLAVSNGTTSPATPAPERIAAGESRTATRPAPIDTPSAMMRPEQALVAAGSSEEKAIVRQGANLPANPDLEAEIEREKKLGTRFAELFNGKTDARFVTARIENRFYQEEWNEAWAGSRESGIRTLFESNEELSDLSPLQVTCRSKNCQVVLPATNSEQARMVSDRFMQVARRGDVGMKDKVVSYFPDVSAGRVVFYLSENGNMDLFQ